MRLSELLVEAKLCKSKGEAKRLIAQGGAAVGGLRMKADCLVGLTPEGKWFLYDLDGLAHSPAGAGTDSA